LSLMTISVRNADYVFEVSGKLLVYHLIVGLKNDRAEVVYTTDPKKATDVVAWFVLHDWHYVYFPVMSECAIAVPGASADDFLKLRAPDLRGF